VVANDLTGWSEADLSASSLRLRGRKLRTAALLVLGVETAVLLEGGDWMFLHRMWVCRLSAFVPAARGAGRRLTIVPPPPRRVSSIAVLLIVSFLVRRRSSGTARTAWRRTAAGYRTAHQSGGRPKGTRSIGRHVALMDVGLIGLRERAPGSDISGLTRISHVAARAGRFSQEGVPVAPFSPRPPRFFVLVNRFKMDGGDQNAPISGGATGWSWSGITYKLDAAG